MNKDHPPSSILTVPVIAPNKVDFPAPLIPTIPLCQKNYYKRRISLVDIKKVVAKQKSYNMYDIQVVHNLTVRK